MQNKKVAILQSNYIPWKGYFDIIAAVDEFIFYDEMQYTKNDWRNRNKIKTPSGLHWLSIPVATKGHISHDVRIMDAKIIDRKWANSHWSTIKQFYKKAPFFKDYADVFEKVYKECEQEEYLCKVNYKFIDAINKILGINTKISFSQDYGLIEGKTERLVDLVKKAGGTEYLSGPAARDYIKANLFEKENIKLSWMDYSGYSEYPQLNPPFEHGVSILDLIFNCGLDARKYMKA
ncbi:MAG: hypothetical protein E7020_05875 [Alphaproteobacteria bacterium]|nr:hypothetical protein [Alphaproteobacteria bacterium]